jgi:Phosphopantetheine attachment site
LRDDQPLTDLGLDSLMGVEIENSIEAAIGVALPPTSLMRARTIGQIVSLIAEHMGAKPSASASVAPEPAAEPASTDEVDLDALTDDDIDKLLGDSAPSDEDPDPQGALK